MLHRVYVIFAKFIASFLYRARLRHVLTEFGLAALRERWYGVARLPSCRQVTARPGQRMQMLAAPGFRSCTLGTTHPELPVFARALLVSQAVQRGLGLLPGEQLPGRVRYPIAPAQPRPAGKECDSAACFWSALQSDAHPLWPARYSLPAARLRSRASGRVLHAGWYSP